MEERAILIDGLEESRGPEFFGKNDDVESGCWGVDTGSIIRSEIGSYCNLSYN